MIKIAETQEYKEWFKELTRKEQAKVLARLEHITFQEHFGDVNNLGDGLCELRWKNGWRVYFIVRTTGNIILIRGGHKNGQEKDIKKARIYISRYTTL